MVKLSICITTYNQSDLLKKNLDEISKYKGEDIEVVISDNCSEEEIGRIVDGYKDRRFHHFRKTKNEGQDGNIIFGISKCKGEYVYLFRTRDIIVSEEIPDIIKILEKYPNATYFLFSALDENGEIRYSLKNKIYTQYDEAIEANSFLLIHPSGQIYKRENLRLELYSKYIRSHFNNNYSFLVHQLIRMDLALQGDFVTSAIYAWKYAYSKKSSTVSSVLDKCSNNKVENIHSFKFNYPRLSCELDFANSELDYPYNVWFLKQLIRDFYIYTVITFPNENRDPDFNRHYNSNLLRITRIGEDIKFYKATKKEIRKLDQKHKGDLIKVLKRCRLKIWFRYLPINCFLKIFNLKTFGSIMGRFNKGMSRMS